MPNHIINNVKISGDAEDVKKCFETIVKPLEVKDYEGIEEVIAKYKKWYGDGKGKNALDIADKRDALDNELEKVMELGKIALENIKLYGHKDWYDWSIENWGTKWDA